VAKLVVIFPSGTNQTHDLGEQWITIGRLEDNVLQIADQSVSSHHCEVKCRGNELLVRDLRSTNGTFVGGVKVTDAVLKFGQVLQVGNVQVRFEASSEVVPKVSLVAASGPAMLPKAVIPLPPKLRESGDAPVRKFQVLFVDDSLAFLDSFANLCGELSGGAWQIHTASTADSALMILQDRTIDLAVLDIGMPMIDGIQLLTIIKQRYPGLKAVVMTGMANEENRAACLIKGAELFLEKPASSEGIKLAFNMLNDLLKWTQQSGFSGTLRQVGLTDVIQMECLNRKSLILEVRNAQIHGQIFIESGVITHAATGQFVGEKAFQQLLALQGGQFQLLPFHQPPDRTVAGHWEFLLMEAARVRDEKNTDSAPAAPQPAPVAPPSAAAVSPPVAEPAKPAEMAPPAGVRGEIIVMEDGDEDKWLSLGGSNTSGS
jgi:CheY-like chemotaxis protein